MIIFNAEESETNSNEFVKGLINAVGLNVETKDTRRIGVEMTGKTRPIRATFSSTEDKEKFMRSLLSLRYADQKYKNYQSQMIIQDEKEIK